MLCIRVHVSYSNSGLTRCWSRILNGEAVPCVQALRKLQWARFAARISVQAKCLMLFKSNLWRQKSNMWINSWVRTPCILPTDRAVFWQITTCKVTYVTYGDNDTVLSRQWREDSFYLINERIIASSHTPVTNFTGNVAAKVDFTAMQLEHEIN